MLFCIRQEEIEPVVFPIVAHPYSALVTRSMHFLITAGPTREAIDPVRFISNRSSGKMGFALAAAAAAAGHEVALITGPVSLATPPGVRRTNVISSLEMYDAVQSSINGTEVAIFAAAVADYAPVHVFSQKLKKSAAEMTLVLKKTPDILASVRQVFNWQGILVGFAAETEDIVRHAHDKLVRKDCDMIVANDVSRSDIGFDSDDNAVTILFRDRPTSSFPIMSKDSLATHLITLCEELHDLR